MALELLLASSDCGASATAGDFGFKILSKISELELCLMEAREDGRDEWCCLSGDMLAVDAASLNPLPLMMRRARLITSFINKQLNFENRDKSFLKMLLHFF